MIDKQVARRMENAGFLAEIVTGDGNEDVSFSIPAPIPEEYGDDVILHIQSPCRWAFFRPNGRDRMKTVLYADTDEATVLFHGSLYNEWSDAESLRHRLLQIRTRAQLAAFLRELSGVFCGLIYRKQEEALFAFTDPYGVEKIYYHQAPGGFQVATHSLLLAQHNGWQNISDFAFGSILYCGHLFAGSAFEGAVPVSAGCYILAEGTGITEQEYVITSEPAGRGAGVEILQNAHRAFWSRMAPHMEGRCGLLLSRGKDSRILLKYMLDAGVRPEILSFFRRNNPMYPFVSFLLEATEDNEAAKQMAASLQLDCRSMHIPNQYLLDNLERIVALNDGPPLHWEFLAAAGNATGGCPYLVSGFEGDIIANLHAPGHLRNGDRIRMARGGFDRIGDAGLYEYMAKILVETGIANPPDLEELAEAWCRQYDVADTDRATLWMQRGFIRTVGAGRSVPTFHQMRFFGRPVYPYLDRDIMTAYQQLSDHELRWKRAHLAQLAGDDRFNRMQVTRLNLSARQEYRLLDLMGLLRYADAFRQRRNNRKHLPSAEKDDALSRTLLDLDFDKALWQRFDCLPRTTAFYASVSRMIAAVRVRNSLRNLTDKHPGDHVLNVLPYCENDKETSHA